MLNLRDASEEDVDARLLELKEEFIALSEGQRADVDDDALKGMIQEVNNLDNWITISGAAKRREAMKIAATAGAGAGMRNRSIGEAVIGTPDFMSFVERGRGGVDGFRTEYTGDEARELSAWLRKASIYGSEGMRAINEWASGGPPTFDSTDSGGLLPVGQPIPPVPRQAKLYLRDLIPTMPTTLATVPYVRELNPTTGESVTGGGATTVAEGATKPSANLSFVSVQAPVATIATTLTLSKQLFEDAPAVIAYINQRLPYLVRFAEDNQILNGNGTWPNMTGINNTSGILTQGVVTVGDYAVTLGQAFAQVENHDGSPTAVVMNPIDAWTMFTKRAAGGSGTFDAGTPFSALPLSVWGVPTYRSRVYPQGKALVADFERGAMLADREQVNTQTYRERYAEQNLILLVCEERLGLLVFRPDLFAQATMG